MGFIKNRKVLIVIAVLVIIFTLCSIVTLPVYKNILRDSGIFLYGGQEILDGKIVYKDFWAHTTPMIFVINAIGLSFGLGVLGVWLVEFILLGFALLYFTLSMIKHFGFWVGSISGVILSVLLRSPTILEGGNLSEIYSVGFILILITYVVNNKDKTIRWIFPGFLSVLIFLTKPSLVAVPISIAFWLLYDLLRKKDKNRLFGMIYFISGVVMTALAAIIILSVFGILRDFWDAVFVYQRSYLSMADLSIFELFKKLIKVLFDHHFENIIMFSLFSAVIIFSYKYFNNDYIRLFFFIVVVGLFFNLILIMLPGTFYGHYFYSLVPILIIGVLLFLVILFSKVFTVVNKNYVKALIIVFLLFLIGLYYPAYQIGKSYIASVDLTPSHFLQAKIKEKSENITANYIKSIPEEYDIFLWGAEPKFYFLAGRECPIKYMFVYPMLTEGYFTEEKFNGVFNKLSSDPPEVIIDVSNAKVPPLDKTDRESFQYIKGYSWGGLEPFYIFVEENYSLADIKVPEQESWQVYVLKGKTLE
jgi:hypothetical protein